MRYGPTGASLAWLHVIFRVLYWPVHEENVPNLRTFAFIGNCSALIFKVALIDRA